MKLFISVILIILLALQAFYPLAIHTYYYANKNFIASTLCENKSKPELQCKGKCHLKKLLKEAEEESKDEATTRNIEAFVYIATSSFLITNVNYSTSAIDHPDLKPDPYSFNYHSPCFRPPCI